MMLLRWGAAWFEGEPDDTEILAIRTEPDIPDPVTPDMQPLVRELIQRARRTVERNPNSAHAWGELAEVCDVHKLLECAEVAYRRAHVLAPDEYRFPYLLGLLLDRTGWGGAESVAMYRAAARLNSRYAPIFFRLGFALERQGDLPAARDAYVRATQVDPRLAIAHRSAGQTLLVLGDVAAARDHLETAARLDPGDGAVYGTMAQMYRRLGDAGRARDAADLARKHRPKLKVPDRVSEAVGARAVDSTSAFRRARGLMSAGRHREAIGYLKVCATAEPDHHMLQVYLATCYHRIGELETCLAHLATALRLKEDSASAHFEMATVLVEMGQLDRALPHYRRLQQIQPDSATIHEKMGDAFLKARHLERAIEAYRVAVRIDADSPAAERLEFLESIRP